MGTKKFLAAATFVSLLAEGAHTEESDAAGKPHFPFLSGSGRGAHDQPHTHSDLETEGHVFRPVRRSLLLAGRGHRPDLFRFTSIASMGNDSLRLVAAPAFGFGPGSQLMYGICAKQDFLDWLAPRLPAAQFSAFRRRYSGESSEPVQLRAFDRRELETMEMTFRPLDDCDPPMFARLMGRA